MRIRADRALVWGFILGGLSVLPFVLSVPLFFLRRDRESVLWLFASFSAPLVFGGASLVLVWLLASPGKGDDARGPGKQE